MPAVASSPMTPALDQLARLGGDDGSEVDIVSLLAVLGQVSDPRDRRGVRHRLTVVLVIGVCAVLGGMRSFVAIAQWAKDSIQTCPALREQLGIVRAPAESTIRRTLQRVDPRELDLLLGGWAQQRTRPCDGLRVVAVDGKNLRGSGRGDDGGQRHLLAAFDHTYGVVLGQVDVAAKTNEVPMLPVLLAGVDIAGAVITADALHAVRSHAVWLHEQGAHYVLTVKANQAALRAQLARLPWGQVSVAHRTREQGHGRREMRTVKTVAVAAAAGPGGRGLLFPHAAQAIKVTRTRTLLTRAKTTKRTTETVYAITSLDVRDASGAQIGGFVRTHWGVENRLHYVRDVAWDEDRSQVRTGNGPQVMASLRNLAITILRLAGETNIAAALRYHASDPNRPLTALLNS
jgi:predicted transposase YbfD/YdcC